MQGRQGHAIAVRHVVQYFLEQPHRRRRNGDGFGGSGAETRRDRVRPVTPFGQLAARLVCKGRITVVRNVAW